MYVYHVLFWENYRALGIAKNIYLVDFNILNDFLHLSFFITIKSTNLLSIKTAAEKI